MRIAEKLLERIAKGEKVTDVVNSMVGHKAIHNTGLMLLSYLRPNDRFLFVGVEAKELNDGISSDTECRVVPANRGFISFTHNGNDVTNLTLEEGLKYPIILRSDQMTVGDRKFMELDRIMHRVDEKKGTVISQAGPDLYAILFDDDDTPIELDSKLLILIEKDKTTGDYIKESNGTWYTGFQGGKEHASQLDAIKYLYTHFKTAFYRYSKFLAYNPQVELDNRIILYLLKVDPRIWRRRDCLERRGAAGLLHAK